MDNAHTIATESEWEARGIDRSRSANWEAVGWSPEEAKAWEDLRPHFKAACLNYSHRGFVRWCIDQRSKGETPDSLEFRVRREAQMMAPIKARPKPEWAKKRLSDLEWLNHHPMEEHAFRDYRYVKVKGGRDEYTSMRLPKLLGQVDAHVRSAVEEAFTEPKHQASVLRWVLRGLLPDRAIRKVRTDLEVSRNAIKQKMMDRLGPYGGV